MANLIRPKGGADGKVGYNTIDCYTAGIFPATAAHSLASSWSHDIYIVTMKLFSAKCHGSENIELFGIQDSLFPSGPDIKR